VNWSECVRTFLARMSRFIERRTPDDDDVAPVDCPEPRGSLALEHGERAALHPLSIDQDVAVDGNDGAFRCNAGCPVVPFGRLGGSPVKSLNALEIKVR
jgi:hypothetical protein